VDFRYAALPVVSADDFGRVNMTHDQGGRVNLAIYSDVHWRRTKLSCCRTFILLAFATIIVTSIF
jgi:hypothetical protein